MNTFYKLFVVKRNEDTCILLYGYGLPDHNETSSNKGHSFHSQPLEGACHLTKTGTVFARQHFLWLRQ
jgi:hypothetical protein